MHWKFNARQAQMKRFAIALSVCLAAPLAAGCAASHLIVEQPNRSAVHAQAITLAYEEGTTGVPQEASAYIQRKMEDAFFGGDNPRFGRGQQLTVRYRFVGFDAGNRLARWAAGPFGAGEAQMVIEAEFVDPNGTTLARVRSQGRVGMGFFGGSSNSAIDQAVKEIAKYAVAHFRE